MSKVGRFVWDELMTVDQGGASEFYRALFGWTASEHDMGELGTYLVMNADEENMVTGLAGAPEGVPQHWVSYLEVADVDAAAKQITALGGSLIAEPFDIPGSGRAVLAKDPSGAGFAAFTGANPDEAPPEEPRLHGVCWHELMTDDVEGTAKFYGELVGYTTEPMGPGVLVLKQGDAMRGTIRQKPEMAKDGPNHWMVYFLVDDVAESSKKAEALGASTLKPSTEIPGMGTFSVQSDPQGGVFALWKNAGAGGRD